MDGETGDSPMDLIHQERRQAAQALQKWEEMVARVASRAKGAAVLADPSELPEIASRVVKVDVQPDVAMADIYFEDGGRIPVHLHMTSTSPRDSDTAAWQEAELARLGLQDDEESLEEWNEAMDRWDAAMARWEASEGIERVAARYMEAGARDWFLKWIVQPAKVLWKHHKEFVQGPVDDAFDAIIKDLAPHVVKAIIEREVDEDVDEFMEGALQGKWDVEQDFLSDPDPGQTTDWREGYEWGFANPALVKKTDLPPDVKQMVVEDAVKTMRRRITEEVVIRAMEKVWDGINPSNTWKAIIAAVKRYGWKLGVVFAVVEIMETLIIPGILIALTDNPKWVLAGQLPLSEILYAIAFRVLGRAIPSEADKFDAEGHLDWYEAQFGPVRLASAQAANVARAYWWQQRVRTYAPPGCYM